ncbi:MAG: YlxM family DNA-binding protein [Lachnospiraceae bacterium]|nr:YlxM family DNA-binding protein [Lachnospiraceae bacterium]
MEDIFKRTLLYDFYGELLTPHQKSIYEEVVYNDMSLGEIAGEFNITRQGVYDIVKRCDKILKQYEEKLQLVKRFENARQKLETALGLADRLDKKEGTELKELLKEIADCL